jgi:inner membrane protein
LTFAAVASHGVLDTFTDAGHGVGLFIPFDNGRYFAPWRPILTSPLSISRFLSERGLAILQNEACWVGVPALAFVATVSAARSILGSRGR